MTSSFVSGNNPDDLISKMSNEMKYIIGWLSTNKLSLNIDKDTTCYSNKKYRQHRSDYKLGKHFSVSILDV